MRLIDGTKRNSKLVLPYLARHGLVLSSPVTQKAEPKVKVDLTSVRAKMARSQEHAQALKAEIRPWLERKPYSIIKERNAEKTRYSIFEKVRVATCE